jgi:putative sigma-54 modulation protein
MNINIQTVHFDADEKLLALVENKVSKLQTFHDNITRVEVFLKLDNLVHNIKDKIVEIKVHIPKQDCFVKATTKSFELSFEQALDSVINQLKKKKDRVAVAY